MIRAGKVLKSMAFSPSMAFSQSMAFSESMALGLIDEHG